MSERTFLIQRYASGNWPQVRGEVPFLATGPTFFRYAYKDSLEKHNEHRFLDVLKADFDEVYGTGQSADEESVRFFAAWALLKEGIVQALWAGHSEVPPEKRWETAVDQLAAEIPKGPIGECVIEYLCGLSDPGHFRTYVSEDQIELVQMEILTE